MDIGIIIFLILLLIGASLGIRKLLKKIEIYESMISESNTMMNNVVNYMGIALKRLHEIDRKQIFEGDDDVGWFFQTLKYEITNLNNKIALIFGEPSEDQEEEEETK